MTGAQFVQRLRALPPRARLAALLALIAIVAAGALAATVARDARVALFATPLRPDQLAEVEQRLAAWSVPHATTNDNVRVDPGKRSGLLLRLPLAGPPPAPPAGTDEALPHLGPPPAPAAIDA